MEALQLAQMLADLNDLQAAQDQSASKALVTANKSLEPNDRSQSPHHRRSVTAEGRITSPSTGARFTDKFGRRIFTPPLTRTNSGTPTSAPGTPRPEGPDTDIDRASTLLSLYEIRAKLKEQDSSSLMKAREKINALAAKQSQRAAEQAKSPAPTSAPSQKNRTEPAKVNYPRRP
ncbi:hypothetical protein F5X99DRAFT_293562 [Biscogniauxia marginata]|nr:hypothetical protein F5X99DRAFT_293562 [Biscogniauxia marginata]